jgi:UDP-glucose 4-epimerase
MNWLITGGCGFIGTSLVDNLISEGGHSIRIIDNLSIGTRHDLREMCDFHEDALEHSGAHQTPGKCELIEGDILNGDLAVKIAQDIDIIVHLAASTGVGHSVKNPILDCKNNVIGTINYLEAARLNNVKRFIFASSGAPVGNCIPPIHEELAPHPVSPYGASKLAGEGYCSAYFHSYGVQTAVLRFANVFGPGSIHKNSVVAKFIRRAIRREMLEIYGDGSQTRDFIYIDDLIQSIRLAARVDGIGGEICQIGSNTEITIKNLTKKILEILANSGLRNVDFSFSTPRKGDVIRSFADTTKAKKILGWESKTTFEEGIMNTVKYYYRLRDQNAC